MDEDAGSNAREDLMIRVQCFPLYSILLALGNPTVHYFSLDIEGAELAVLKVICFNYSKLNNIGTVTFKLSLTDPSL